MSRDDLDADVPLATLCELLHPGATLVLTQGANGGIALRGGPGGPTGMRRWPGIPPAAIVDPTGAGDVFLAALLAARVEPRLVGGRLGAQLDLRLAAAAASLVLEGPGLAGVPTREAVKRRIAELPRGRGDAGG
ncbi:MAG: PfkB family carbohydrate kinase [Candidatus Limnocylindrales bacterium]